MLLSSFKCYKNWQKARKFSKISIFSLFSLNILKFYSQLGVLNLFEFWKTVKFDYSFFCIKVNIINPKAAISTPIPAINSSVQKYLTAALNEQFFSLFYFFPIPPTFKKICASLSWAHSIYLMFNLRFESFHSSLQHELLLSM